MWQHQEMDLQNKNVVITGASMGIGEKMADAFTTAGATVLVIARSTGKLQAVADRNGGHALTADLSTAEGVDGLVQRCVDTLGHIDVWVNNAGVETTDAFVLSDRNQLRDLARLNFEAPLLLSHDVINHMLGRGQGHVVQLSSIAGAIPFPGLAAYAGSKAGLTNFTESLRLELADLEKQQSTYQRKNIQYTILKREVDSNRSQYESLITKLSDVGIGSELRDASANIVELAVPAARPLSPKLLFNLAAFLVAFSGLAIAIIYILQLINNTFSVPFTAGTIKSF